jgi:hypothetical protein
MADSLKMQLAQRFAKRTRVASACIQCRLSRTKCNDTRPCARCIRSGIGNCGYNKVLTAKRRFCASSDSSYFPAPVEGSLGLHSMIRDSAHGLDQGQLSVASTPAQRMRTFDDHARDICFETFEETADFSRPRIANASLPSCYFSLCTNPFEESANACPNAPPLCWWQPWCVPPSLPILDDACQRLSSRRPGVPASYFISW